MNASAFLSPPPALPLILERTEAIGFGMASEPLTGSLLRALAASKPGGRFLELGTGTGVATAWLLDGMDEDSTLDSVDVDPAPQQVARDVLGADERLRIWTADGLEFLRDERRGAYDLVFADAMPGKYDGLEAALNVVAEGGFYVIDDLLPQPNWPPGHAAKVPVLLAALAARPDFVMVPMEWASGVVVVVRKFV